MRDSYDRLMSQPGQIEDILQAGASKARQIATPFMAELRQVVGLRSLRSTGPATGRGSAATQALASFKQYRESDGKFYFKLLSADGDVLLQSLGLSSPQEAGALVSRLKQGDFSVLQSHAAAFLPPEPSLQPALEQALQALKLAGKPKSN